MNGLVSLRRLPRYQKLQKLLQSRLLCIQRGKLLPKVVVWLHFLSDGQFMSPIKNNKFVLVTGATGGIGSEVCRALHLKGYAPILGYRRGKASALKLAEEVCGCVCRFDMANLLEIDTAIDSLSSLPGQIVGAVHCASPPPKLSTFSRISEKDLIFFWQQNVLGAHRLFARLVKKFLRKSRSGIIVVISSGAMEGEGKSAMKNLGAYTISKYGLNGVIALLAAENTWLKVSTVSPGFTDTKMLKAFDERFIEQIAKNNPLHKPSEIAVEIVKQFPEMV
jgi:NAD(P)-dependent dehydrogenase (short-subunit alcohol dehydrogenase family)